MLTKKNLIAVTAGFICVTVLVWFCGSTGANEWRDQMEYVILAPGNQSDTARAIDSYEYLMERYMLMTERNFSGIGVDVQEVVKKLDSIDAKLNNISARMSKIEKALGIKGAGKKAKGHRGAKKYRTDTNQCQKPLE